MTPKGGIKPHSKFGVKSNRSEVLFVDYILNHLRPKGRAGIIVPETILFLTNSAYKDVRSLLVENGLYAVVSLPSGVFLPYSSVKTSILLFDNEIGRTKDEVCFIKISSDGFELIGTRKPTNQNDLPDAKLLLNDFLADRDVVDSRVLLIDKARIAEDGNYFLNIERYQEKGEVSSNHSMATFEEIFSPNDNQKVGNRDLPVMSITMAHGLIDQSDKFKRRIASTNIESYKIVKRNELVVGFPIDEGVLGFLTTYDEAAVSPAYGIWKLNDPERFDVEYLELVLRSMQMREIYKANMQGAVGRRRTVPKDVFLKLEIPAPDIEIQRSLVAEINSEKEQKELARKKIESHEEQIQNLISKLWVG
jgi:type I restriction enzyme M protein